MNQFMYLLMAPYMFYPPWGDVWDANDNKTTAKFQRLIHAGEIFEAQQCTEFEAMLYISTATLSHPSGHDWFNIYMWLFNRWNPERAKEQDLLPDRPELNVNQKEDLSRLRRWIFSQQMGHIKEKRKAAENGTPSKHLDTVAHLVVAPEVVVQQPQMF